MRKDREFDDVLDECLERLLVNGEIVEQCLQSFPEQRVELKPLLRTAVDVRKASAVEPRAEFKARARYQFHRALAELQPKRRLWAWEWRPRWATAAIVSLVILFAATGMGIATYHSMPGQLLHPLRLTAEDVWLARIPSGIARAEMHGGLAERRVEEIISLAKREDKSAKVEQVAQRLYYHLAMIESLAAAETVVARTHVVGQETVLHAQQDAAEVERDASVAEAAVEEVAGVMVPTGEAGPAGPAGQQEPDVVGVDALFEVATIPAAAEAGERHLLFAAEEAARWAQFKTTLEQQAADHLAALRGLLPVVSESARPALLTAIAIAEAGYERATRIGVAP